MDNKELYKNFLKEYDSGNLEFNNLNYRQGAIITCKFGLAEGYRKNRNGEFVWDSVRIHTGVDRAGTDVVYAPFKFQRSAFYDFGKDHAYGSMIRLYQDEYGFEMRIMHMHPEIDINNNILPLLKQNKPIRRNALLGQEGDYGMVDGAHTHTDIVSYEETNPILNFLLYEKFGEETMQPFTEDEVVEYYKSRPYFKSKSKKTILEHFEEMIKSRSLVSKDYFNKYFFRFHDWFSPSHDKIRTKYSSELLFNGL